MSMLLIPGDLVCDLVGLPTNSDHRQILRMFINTVVWGLVGTGVAFMISA